MGEVQLYQHIGSLCRSTDELMKLYPWATQYVMATDYAKLEAEAQALREQNTKFQHMLADVVAKHFAENIKRSTAQKSMDVYLSEGIRLLEEELETLRARVAVVPGRIPSNGPKEEWYLTGWNACLDELARLNGKAVSEGLLRGMAAFALELVRAALEGGSFDGAEIQESAERHGVIAKQVMNEPCCGPEEHCACAWATSFPTECYRIKPELHALLDGEPT